MTEGLGNGERAVADCTRADSGTVQKRKHPACVALRPRGRLRPRPAYIQPKQPLAQLAEENEEDERRKPRTVINGGNAA
jgi:hypothetical protein